MSDPNEVTKLPQDSIAFLDEKLALNKIAASAMYGKRVGEWEITAIKPDIPITVDMIEAVMTGMCSLPHQSHRHIEQAKRFMRLLVPIVTAAEQQQRDAVAQANWPVDHADGKE